MEKVQTDRREFVKFSTLGILGLALGGGMVFSPYLVGKENRLRPPGAVSEDKFLALCIKCGQCLQVCPYHSIKLADFAKGIGVGTPYIDANERGCWACDAVPCVLACPSGALDHHCEKPQDIKMGIAVLEFPNTCLAISNTLIPKGYNDKMHNFVNSVRNKTEQEDVILKKLDEFEGKECTLCADMCPIPNPLSAIAMIADSGGGKRPEVYDGCIGCGACQEVCPTTQPSIVVKPRVMYNEFYNKA
ncbi:MAG: 4Fe-4S ferredoxin [Sulfurimonas sp. RIFOXYD12_FULL_33_39]|uniref:4Fe-4S dicluster domain-containing protein n=1 Tax=unclassified Sulfurimonas TaxID=2623549 RepID=UPI0008D8A540|nr:MULTISPECIES: 4Fe-4S dicluster domain-containing protein [unclassified Sulfurimonas]OHE07718.1 MAG: 4Fe-4S ferredoxin [Sulfurimonas sp. RIFCSPLOWO2_12_FULL_34_6]OHE10031.1 MAG: 4Fe-4S ferredoxin [Sulfurimonas sp. RIFOXYD12_FULL_33_39]OHE14748.1 MAG: 4Fe-4S ferredoxin [Sulfurimonas sp. RIFOXYD2_FULL_34_21]